MRWLLFRLIRTGALLAAASLLVFLFGELAPGDFASSLDVNPSVSRENAAALRQSLGLDQPLAVRYSRWLAAALQGDLGLSFAYRQPVTTLLLPRLRNTLLLTGAALVLSWLAGVALGTLCAVRSRGILSHLVSGAMAGLVAAPDLLVALGILLVSLQTGTAQSAHRFAFALLALTLVALPAVVRHTQSSVLEVLESPFVASARALGIARLRLLTHYILPASLNPLISIFGLSVGSLLSSSLIVEVVLSWPGLGPLLLEAVLARDIHLVLAAALMSTLLLQAGNLLADLLLLWNDPRIRPNA